MSQGFFIGPIDVSVWKDADDDAKPTSDLRIEPEAYTRALAERWSGIEVAPKAMSHCLLYWELPGESGEATGVWGALFNDGQLVSFGSGPQRHVLDFIRWHRDVIPADVPLYLFRASEWETLPLTAQTTDADIIAFTGV